ncbi:MAG: hypothetical protein KCHDKBKB_02411 [Elusimicrobia bacterium]|nr:hypothetical protein [Elusimicrobiota bacterium]
MTVRKQFTIILLCAGFLGNVAGAQGPYKIIKKVPLVGDSGWDYLTLDVAQRRLYVAHGTRVNVMDVDSHQPVGIIANTPGVHGVAIAGPFNRGFITQGRTDSVVAFDLKTLKKIGETPAQKNPDFVLYDPVSQRVFVFNSQTNSATVVDPQTIEPVATLTLSGKPEQGVADGQGRVYVNLRDQNKIAQINSRVLKVEKELPIAGCQQPTTLALDAINRRLFAGCANKVLAVLDAESGQNVALLPIGDRCDTTLYDPESALIFNSNNDGTVTIIKQNSPDKYSVQETLTTQIGARTAAYDPKTKTLFLAVAEFGPLPEPTESNPKPKQKILPGTFNILVATP